MRTETRSTRPRCECGLLSEDEKYGRVTSALLGKDRFAVRCLAAGTRSLRERLTTAWWYSLVELEARPLPWDDLQQKFADIKERLIPEVSPQVDRTVPRRDEPLVQIAEDIVALFNEVVERCA